MTPEIISIATAKANETGLKPELVIAVIKKETGGDTWLTRYESNWIYFVDYIDWAKRLTASGRTTTGLTERINQATSWGCMQVMGAVARELGHAGPLTMMTDPAIGIFFGCKKLKQLMDKHRDTRKALAAYNAGSPESPMGLDYADKVMASMANA